MADEKKSAARKTGEREESPRKSSREAAQEEGKLNLRGEGSDEVAAPSPPGFKRGMNWNSDDARRAYEEAGSSFEEQQRKGAEGEPSGSQ